jgi:hypothetical protein
MSGALNRAESGYSAAVYAPHYAPQDLEKPPSTSQLLDTQAQSSELAKIPGTTAACGCSSFDIQQQGYRFLLLSPTQLRLHPALDEIGWTGLIDEFPESVPTAPKSDFDPIIITADRVILAGFSAWRLAIQENRREIRCTQYAGADDEAIEFMIKRHRSRRGWNDFVRIRLALRQKPHLQERALANMRSGGEHKGLTNLTKAERIDVRQEIAHLAGTGTGNISKVERILEKCHRSIIAALQIGALRIHRAWGWCELSKSEQITSFECFEEERTRRKILRDVSIASSEAANEPLKIIELLLEQEARNPGCIRIRRSDSMRTEIRVGRSLLASLGARNEDLLA